MKALEKFHLTLGLTLKCTKARKPWSISENCMILSIHVRIKAANHVYSVEFFSQDYRKSRPAKDACGKKGLQEERALR